VEGRTIRHLVNIHDVWIDKIDRAGALARIDDFVAAGTPHHVVTANVDYLRLTGQVPGFRDLINTADLVLPDGMPLLWGSRLLGSPLPERVTGVDMLVDCAGLAAAKGYGLFLLGAGPGVAEEAARVLRARCPGVRVVGTYAPPMRPLTPSENEATVRVIQEMQPDMLFVAFGAPKQDQWIRAHLDRLGVPVCMGVGGAFDMLAGRVKRAPTWMQHGGLEWLYRVTQEPTRLWQRYFVHDLPCFVRLMAQCSATPAERAVTARPAGLRARAAEGLAEGYAPLMAQEPDSYAAT
jgi:N-acetylglucosaminyldiphosphoundecaprenol N-acetyl-beta-D-mannosaminyltransferase